MPVSIGDQTVGDIVAADIRTTRIFENYGIDFCDEGQETLATICLERGLNLYAITQEIFDLSQDEEKEETSCRQNLTR